MPTCSICRTVKKESEFFFRDSRRKILHAQCKACYSDDRKRYAKQHYQKYKHLYIERAKARKTTVGAELRAKMLAYLGDKECERCGMKDIRVLDFDHIDPAKKSFSIARGLINCLEWEKILEKIAKCRILCANCHWIRTAEQFNWYRQ